MHPIRCGLPPGTNPGVAAALNEPLRQWLQGRVGRPVELVICPSPAAPGEALRRGELDIAYLGPVTYILQSRKAPLEAFARPSHGGRTGPTFQAVIIAPFSSSVSTLNELSGKEVAFADLTSVAACWAPRHMLLEAGLVLGRDYQQRMLGSEERIAQAVALHEVAAGGLSLAVLQRLLATGAIGEEAVRILALSMPIPEAMWTFRSGLPDDLREAVRKGFLDLRDPDALAPYRAQAFIPAVDADVDRVRAWMEAVLQARL